MDAFTDIGWFLYISLDSYKVWMHLQKHWLFLYISLDSYKSHGYLQKPLVGFCKCIS